MRFFSSAVLSLLGMISVCTCAQAQKSLLHDWSGVYLGGAIGGAESIGKTGASTSDEAPDSYFTPPDPEQIAAEMDGKISQWSLSGGVFGGYGRQSGNLYLGVEGSASNLSFDDSRAVSAVYLSNSDGRFTNSLSVEADWQATLRTRLGWAQDRWLAYVTGGAAVTRVGLDARFTDDFLAGAAGQASGKETKVGFVLGLGGEYVLNDNWSVRGEYLYADYGSVDVSLLLANPDYPTQANTLQNSIDLKTQSLFVGLSYRF